jgi:hypothetical protein
MLYPRTTFMAISLAICTSACGDKPEPQETESDSAATTEPATTEPAATESTTDPPLSTGSDAPTEATESAPQDTETTSETTGGMDTLATCDVPEPCADTWFGCDADSCPNTNQAERVCVLSLLRDGTAARFRPEDGLGDGDPWIWVITGDAERTVLFAANPDKTQPRRCTLKPPEFFQACIDNASDPWDECNHIGSWVEAVDFWQDCLKADPFVCPAGA